jgi:hypothetical protein
LPGTSITAGRLFRAVDLRNWIVYGNASTPAARGAQRGMRLAHAAYGFLRRRGDQKELAKKRLSEVLAEIDAR